MDARHVAALGILFLLRRDDLLSLDARRRLYDEAVRFPGLHLRELARRTGLDAKHADYHLRTLVKHDLLTTREQDGYLTYWPRAEGEAGRRDVVDARDKAFVGLLRRPLPLHITLVLLDSGPASATALSQRTGSARTTLLYHLDRMVREGLLLSQVEGKETLYAVADADRVAGLLMRFRPPDELVAGFLEAWESLELAPAPAEP